MKAELCDPPPSYLPLYSQATRGTSCLRLERLRSAVAPSATTSMIHEHARPQIRLHFLSVPSSPLQGYDESYTETAYESYDSYYSQPQA